MLNSTKHEISFGLKKKLPKNLNFFHAQLSWAYSTELSMKEVLKKCQYFKICKQNKFHAQLSWAWKKFYNLGARKYKLHYSEVRIDVLRPSYGINTIRSEGK